MYGYGFPSYMLTNNNARIRDAKLRLEKAKKLKETETKEYVINDVRVVENTEDNRLQLFFSGVPSEDIRDQLKYNAFRWSRYNKCWQSYLNRRQISRALLNNHEYYSVRNSDRLPELCEMWSKIPFALSPVSWRRCWM